MQINSLRGNIDLGEKLFRIGFIAYCIFCFYKISALPRMVSIPFFIKEGIPYIIFYSCLSIKIFFIDQFSKKEKIAFFIFLIYTIVNYIICGYYTEPLVFFFFIMAGKNVSADKTIKTWLLTIIPIYLIMIALSILGKTNDPVYMANGHIRRSMGFIYPTDFAALTYYMFLSYSFLAKKYKISYVALGCFISFYLFFLCRARTGAIIVMLTTISFLLLSNIKIFINKRILKIISFSMITICIISFIIASLFNSNNYILNKMDSLLSGRIKLENKALNTLPFSLWGSNFRQAGIPDVEYYNATNAEYFFLDSSYFYILFRFGFIALALILYGYTKTSLKNANQGNWKIPLIIAIISIACISEGFLLDFGFNPFNILLLGTIFNDTAENKIAYSKEEAPLHDK